MNYRRMDVNSKIPGLLFRKLDGSITDEENSLLIEWSNQSAANTRLLQDLTTTRNIEPQPGDISSR